MIHRVRDGGVCFAQLALDTPTGPISLDARPSDAIALAVRAGCPIFMARTVLETTGYESDDAKGTYDAYTLTELDNLLTELIKKEDYEGATRIRDAIEKRGTN